MANRPEKRKKERRAASAQLVFGEDDDLITWLNSIPDGQRQATIKATLRAGLGLPQPPQRSNDLDILRAELATVQGALAQLPRLIQSGNGADELVGQMSEIESRVNHLAAWLERDLAGFVSDVVQRSIGGQLPAPDEPTVQDAPQLSKKEQALRKAKLNKTSW